METRNKTDQEIRLQGFRALRDELGLSGFIRFMQQFERGHGDYVEDRQQWQQSYTVETALNDMIQQGYLEDNA